MTPFFWLLQLGLITALAAANPIGRLLAELAARLRRRFRRRRHARILAVTDARLLEDMGISRDVVWQVFHEPEALRDGRTALKFPPADRTARRRY